MDRKISQLPAVSYITAADIIPVVRNLSTTPSNHSIKVEDLFGDIRTDVTITTGELTANVASLNTTTANTVSTTELTVSDADITKLKLTEKITPSDSSGPGLETNRIFFDDNYLYIKISNTVVKRVALSNF